MRLLVSALDTIIWLTLDFQEKLAIFNNKNYLYRKPTQVDR